MKSAPAVFVLLSLSAGVAGESAAPHGYRLATFEADVTVPLGHALMGGGIEPARTIRDPLLARGVVLEGVEQPIVLVAVDWCEIRNDAYERWRQVLAAAARTVPSRVWVSSVHQHDAPVVDLHAQRLLDRHGLRGALCDVDFHERAVESVARSLRAALKNPRRISHFGTGQAKVEKIASNRRIERPDGTVSFPRNSATGDAAVRAAPAGTIDPWLKTLSFWDGEHAVAALSCYATHPMSYYGKGDVSSDFVGLARARRQADDASVFQVYFSGCSGDVTAGKYNDGAVENRPVLADRLHRAMVEAWASTKRFPLVAVEHRIVPLSLEPRTAGGFGVEDLEKTLADPMQPTFSRVLAAFGLSWHRRVAAGRPIDIPVLDLGTATFLLMPAESFVGYQLLAQRLRPGSFVMVAGYGECAPGYIPTAATTREGFIDSHRWCWVTPDAPAAMEAALERALRRDAEK